MRATQEDELTPWHRAFRVVGDDATILHPVNAVGSVRWHTAFAYVDAARSRSNLTILPETLVDRVPVEDGCATGANTVRGELSAETVVIVAGAYGSPGILLRSGIGPAPELRRHRIPLVAELPVGEGLVDHVGTGAAWVPTELLVRETEAHETRHGLFMAQVTISRRGRTCPPGVNDLFLFPALNPGPEISAAAFAMKPLSRGSVRLRSREPDVPLAIDHGFPA